ncbi:hypothetical protein SCLCIDRAFT_1221076 [Scleroderma citrinum Foug A]|uniref:Uncharacterized protein n=1 Tax=Scleroderma citrinum Foug A TaxID=1036808 RepID=A0A0C3D3N1_9AGAM|nr:hypothetical protein SCLCIDRAFT_1221076 [Scleroderma citrinum Foug A]
MTAKTVQIVCVVRKGHPHTPKIVPTKLYRAEAMGWTLVPLLAITAAPEISPRASPHTSMQCPIQSRSCCHPKPCRSNGRVQ